MLKFQGDYTTLIAIFEDFILLVYTIIDDLICSELIGIDSENAWYSFVKRNYRHLFPNLCCRTRFNRTRRALLQVTLGTKAIQGKNLFSKI